MSVSLSLVPGAVGDGLPCTITGHAGGFPGPHALTLRGQLLRGRWRLAVRVREAVHNQLLLVTLNGRRVDALGVPFAGDSDDNWPDSRRDGLTGAMLDFSRAVKQKYGLADQYARQLANRGEWTLTTRFVTDGEAETVIELANHNGDNCGAGPVFYHGDGIEILGIELTADTAADPDTFARANPGLPMLDAWGWMVYLGFDNPDRREPGLEETKTEAIRDAYSRGANLVELNPGVRDGLPFDLTGLSAAVETARSEWHTETVRELFRCAWRYGMLKELFWFALAGFNNFRAQAPEDILAVVQRVQELLGCGDTPEQLEAAIDGAMYEFFPQDQPRQTDAAWRVNPGTVQMVSGGITGTAMELKNNGFAAGWANYTAHWVGASVHQTGYDCLFRAVPYPKDFYKRARQINWSYLQGCAESLRYEESRMVRPGSVLRGIPGRDAAPDWIVAQLQGFAERRWRDETDRVCSALCWEAVSPQVCAPDARKMLYAATQDPIRAALAGTLTDTGRAGTIDLKRDADRYPAVDQVRISERHAQPAASHFLRNQDLEYVALPGRDYNLLQADLTRGARFHANGSLVRLFQPLFITTAEAAGTSAFEPATRVAETGGPLAELEQTFRVVDRRGEYREARRLRLLADTPAIEVRVRRTLTVAADAAPMVLGNALFPHAAYTFETLTQSADKLVFALTDPEGVLPALRLVVLGRDLGAPTTSGPILFDTPLAAAHELTVRVLAARGSITPAQLDLAEDEAFWHAPTLDLPAQRDNVALEHTWPVPLTRAVVLEPRRNAPCRVREQGWWHYRGVIPGETFGHQDFLKVHCHPGDTPVIARDSLIGGEIGWGWGSQYTVLIGDVRDGGAGWLAATVRVAGITPFIFAPRVRLRAPAAELELDGRKWLYADGETVFFPNRPGDYELRWRYGEVTEPRLLRTYAVVDGAEVTAAGLVLHTALPEFVPEDPGFHGWYVLVDDAGTRQVHPITIGDCTIAR